MASSRPSKPGGLGRGRLDQSHSSPMTRYLILYNLVSASLWLILLVRTLILFPNYGNARVWNDLNAFARWTQTLAILEVLHAVAGIVHASPITTALQVSGRNTIVWAITRNYPDVAAGDWVYSVMLIAWGISEVIRYSYYFVERATGEVPGWLVWLRYNMWIVLYPIGFPCEAWFVYRVIEPSKERNPVYPYLLWFGLILYIPAPFVLFRHMFAQRRKRAQRRQAEAKRS